MILRKNLHFKYKFFLFFLLMSLENINPLHLSHKDSSLNSEKYLKLRSLLMQQIIDNFSPNSLSNSEPSNDHNPTQKKLSHFGDMKKFSMDEIKLNFIKTDDLKGDINHIVNIDIPENKSSPEGKTEEKKYFVESENQKSPKGQTGRGLTNKAQNNYFVSDNSLKIENRSFGEIIENDLSFDYKVFFQFFIMHFLFYVILGPFSCFFIAMIWGWNLAKNQFFWGINSEFVFQVSEFLTVLCVLSLFYSYNFKNIYMIEIYMIMEAIFLRISIISIKYATMNEDKIKLLKTKEISHEDLKKEFTLQYFSDINEVELEKELQNTIIRKDIDVALLLFQFLGEVNTEIQSQIESDYNPFQRENPGNQIKIDSFDGDRQKSIVSQTSSNLTNFEEKNMSSNFFSSNSSTPVYGIKKTSIISSPLTSMNSFLSISKVGKRINLYNEFINDDCKRKIYSGYSLAKLIIRKGYEEGMKAKWFLTIVIFISFLHAAIPSFYREYTKGFLLGEGFLESFLIVLVFVLNFLLFFINFSFLLFGIFDFERQRKCLNQLSNLLASKKMVFSDKKFTPTIDFFCKFSLKSWGSLHKIIRSFGGKYKKRVECYLTLFSLFYLLITILIISAIFGNLEGLYSFINLIILISEVIVVSSCMIALIKIGVGINKQYQIHIGLIKTNKDVISDLLRLYMVYFEKKEYTPENEVYKKGVEKINQTVNYHLSNNILICNPKKWVHDEMKKKMTKRVLKDLICICDEIIEELTFENLYEPFRINGMAATTKVLHSILAVLGSIFFAIGQKYLNHLVN